MFTHGSRTRCGVVLAACACALACAPRTADRLVLGSPRLPALGLVFVAEQTGCLGAERLAVEHRAFDSGRDALRALVAGEVDVAAAFETPIALQAPAHPELRILTSLHVSRLDTRLVARADRGISAPAGLRGKRVGVPRDTNAEFFLDTLLALGEVPRDRVTVVDLPPPRVAAALASGDVDAVAIWSPYANAAEAAPGGTVTLLSDVYGEISALVTRNDVVTARRGALGKLLRCLVRSERLALDRPDEAWTLLRRAFPEVPEALLRDEWSRVTPQLGVANVLVSVLRQESDWLRRRGRAGGAVDPGALLEPDLLRAVAPEAITYVGRD